MLTEHVFIHKGLIILRLNFPINEVVINASTFDLLGLLWDLNRAIYVYCFKTSIEIPLLAQFHTQSTSSSGACLLNLNILEPSSYLETLLLSHFLYHILFFNAHTCTHHYPPQPCHFTISKEPFLSCIHFSETSSCLFITQYSLFADRTPILMDRAMCSAIKTHFQTSFVAIASQRNKHQRWMNQKKSRSFCIIIIPLLLIKKQAQRGSTACPQTFSPSDCKDDVPSTTVRCSYKVLIPYSGLFMSFIIFQPC